MDIVYNDDDLERLEFDPKFTANLAQGLVKAYRKKIQAIRAADDERDLYTQRSNNFEELQGKRKGQYSIRLNNQFRLVFEFSQTTSSQKKVVVVKIEDYH